MGEVVDLEMLRTELDVQVRKNTAWRSGRTPEDALAASEAFRARFGGDRRLTIAKAIWWLKHAHLPRTPSQPRSAATLHPQPGETP